LINTTNSGVNIVPEQLQAMRNVSTQFVSVKVENKAGDYGSQSPLDMICLCQMIHMVLLKPSATHSHPAVKQLAL
jgi:hypothetical protein